MRMLLLKLKSYLPRRLPTGKASFDAWIGDIVALSGLPNNASTQRVAAMFILQLPPALAYLSLRKVVNQLVKAASNQVAQAVLKDTDAQPQATKAN